MLSSIIIIFLYFSISISLDGNGGGVDVPSSIVSIHETIVVQYLQRIESGLHAFGDADNCDENGAHESENHHRPNNFYTAGYLWNKVQSLIQQLLPTIIWIVAIESNWYKW